MGFTVKPKSRFARAWKWIAIPQTEFKRAACPPQVGDMIKLGQCSLSNIKTITISSLYGFIICTFQNALPKKLYLKHPLILFKTKTN